MPHVITGRSAAAAYKTEMAATVPPNPQRIPPPFRPYSSTPIFRAGNSNDDELPEEAPASQLERSQDGKGPYWVELPERDGEGEKDFSGWAQPRRITLVERMDFG